MKKISLLSVFSFLCLFSFGQNAKVDSLMNVLKTAKEDTAKVSTLNELSYEFRNNDPDTSIYFANEAIPLATKLNYKMGIVDAYLRIGTSLTNLGKYEDALIKLNDALKLNESLLTLEKKIDKLKILKQKANAYNSMGIIYHYQSNYCLHRRILTPHTCEADPLFRGY